MAIRIVRLGGPRAKGEGPRLGTARRLPRGVRKSDYAKRNYFDIWFPELAPSQKLLSFATAQPLTGARWARFSKVYRREMEKPGARRILSVLAQLSHQANFSAGCYCEREDRCHRSLLRMLLKERGAKLA